MAGGLFRQDRHDGALWDARRVVGPWAASFSVGSQAVDRRVLWAVVREPFGGNRGLQK